jgi:hypothetical protein
VIALNQGANAKVEAGRGCFTEDTRESGQIAIARDRATHDTYARAVVSIEKFDRHQTVALVRYRLLDREGHDVDPKDLIGYEPHLCPIDTEFSLTTETLVEWSYKTELRVFLAGLIGEFPRDPGVKQYLRYKVNQTAALATGAALRMITAVDPSGAKRECDVTAPAEVTFAGFAALPVEVKLAAGRSEAVPTMRMAALLQYRPIANRDRHRCPEGATFIALSDELQQLLSALLLATPANR